MFTNKRIRVSGPLVPDDYIYSTPYGRVTRFDLYDRYAQTVQGGLSFYAGRYSPFSGGELIMRAVIAMLPSATVKQNQGLMHKLYTGLLHIGYNVEKDDGSQQNEPVLPAIYVDHRYPTLKPGFFSDDKTGEPLGYQDLIRYLDLLHTALAQTERMQCDRMARLLVQAVKRLAAPDCAEHTRDIEDLLSRAMKIQGYRLKMVDWYKTSVAARSH